MLSAEEAMTRLQEGNRRFASDERHIAALATPERRTKLVSTQRPFAVILGCSDSRVPAEIVFDEGLGDLFVIRVAGNVVAPTQIGSVEFAAEVFGTRLVVVLGHSRCGVVSATVKELTQPGGHGSKNMRSIVNRVRPSVEPLLNGGGVRDLDTLVEQAVRANVRASVDQLCSCSEILGRLIEEDRLLIVGAKYSLETGLVEFFDDAPQ